jgi:alpha-D-xyloside xylohydrolase
VEEKTEDWLSYPYAFYDAYNPAARKMYWDQINEHIFSKGIDAWWLDATEPETRSNQTAEEMEDRMNPNWFGTGVKYLNLYPLFACEAVFEGQRNVKPNQRVFILTRSAFAGQQKYAGTTWSGDVTARWSTFKAQIPAGLNYVISGLPYWTTDIGAFTVPYEGGNQNEEYRELFTRWYQFGAFCPIFRVHGTSTPREIWHFGGPGHPAYDSQLMFDKLRYALMPYIYSIANTVQFKHYTMMRPLIMDFPNDIKVYDIPDEYMFGPAFLVCPVTDYKARERSVYLPDCEGWYDFWTGRFYEGGQEIMADAPYEKMPLFVKAGSVIPFGPEIQYTSEKPANPITLWVYEGNNGYFTIYEDDGLTYNYDELSEFLTIPVDYNDENKNLDIHDQVGKYPGYLNKRNFRVVWVDKENPVGYNPAVKPVQDIVYEGKAVMISKK